MPRFIAIVDDEKWQRCARATRTLMSLHRRDYRRWRDLYDKLHAVNTEVYRLISEIRTAISDIGETEAVDEIDRDIVKPFDALLANFGSRTFGDVLQDLRSAIKSLEESVNGVISRHERR